jgi:hypothetical protein
VAISDASASGYCAFTIDSSYPLFQQGVFTDDEMRTSSGMRELLAIRAFLLTFAGRIEDLQLRRIYWLTDSQNVTAFLSKGSPKPHINNLILQIIHLAKGKGFYILPIHLRREDPRMQLADQGSRFVSSDEWSDDEEMKTQSPRFKPS